jgi:LEA14-like dessication related protein
MSNLEDDETFEESLDEEIEDEPPKEKKSKKKLFRMIIFFIILIIIFGIIANLIMVYLAASSVEVVNKRLNKLEALSIDTYEITFTLTLENPTDTTIDIDKITYDAYLEDSYLGKGFKTDLAIDPGVEDYMFTFSFKLQDLSEAVRQNFLSNSATLKINGEITIPVKFMGVAEFMKITLPYDFTEEVSRS